MVSHCRQAGHEPAELVRHDKEGLYVAHVYQPMDLPAPFRLHNLTNVILFSKLSLLKDQVNSNVF